jgi:acetylornithine deacetylase/succinyl-diaminopimelate desuccinylase-like protein
MFGVSFVSHLVLVFRELYRMRRTASQNRMRPLVDAIAEGGGTDAAFASLSTRAPVIERFGLQGFGAHSNDAEYIAVDSIEPRLCLLARLVMDVAQGRGRQP